MTWLGGAPSRKTLRVTETAAMGQRLPLADGRRTAKFSLKRDRVRETQTRGEEETAEGRVARASLLAVGRRPHHCSLDLSFGVERDFDDERAICKRGPVFVVSHHADVLEFDRPQFAERQQ